MGKVINNAIVMKIAIRIMIKVFLERLEKKRRYELAK